MTRKNALAAMVAVALALQAAGSGAQSPEEWFRSGRAAVEKAKLEKPVMGRARNVILFLGDGMGISTVTAARSRMVFIELAATARKSPRATRSLTEIRPSLVFMPVTIALMVGAESEICWFAL